MNQISSYETFQDGQVIFKEGDNGDWLYIVMDGEVQLTKAVGNHKIIIDVIMPGEIFGELSYIDKKPRSATATARGITEVGIVDRDFFDREINSLSSDFQKMLRTVTFRMRKANQKILEITPKQD
jgi:CRP/FNR family transcriptional regulator, cyclic AMP receptor protein